MQHTFGSELSPVPKHVGSYLSPHMLKPLQVLVSEHFLNWLMYLGPTPANDVCLATNPGHHRCVFAFPVVGVALSPLAAYSHLPDFQLHELAVHAPLSHALLRQQYPSDLVQV